MLDAVLTVEKLSSNRIGLDDMYCTCHGIDAWRGTHGDWAAKSSPHGGFAHHLSRRTRAHSRAKVHFNL